MNWLLWVLLTLLVVYFIRQSMPVKGVKNINTTDLKTILADKTYRDKQFIDVRTPMEFQQFKVKYFTNIPLQLLRKQCEQLDKDKEVVLICRSGSRSMRAARILKNNGFTKITNVAGGLNHWNKG